MYRKAKEKSLLCPQQKRYRAVARTANFTITTRTWTPTSARCRWTRTRWCPSSAATRGGALTSASMTNIRACISKYDKERTSPTSHARLGLFSWSTLASDYSNCYTPPILLSLFKRSSNWDLSVCLKFRLYGRVHSNRLLSHNAMFLVSVVGEGLASPATHIAAIGFIMIANLCRNMEYFQYHAPADSSPSYQVFRAIVF